jgi:hypothetical protein
MQARLADGIGPTGVYVACVATGALYTLLRVTAVPVYCAERHRGHFRSALPIGSDEHVIRTDADNRPYGRAVLDFAGLSGVTRSVDLARVLAGCVYAGQERRAVIVNPAFGLHR